jgi:hypothetical protein
MKVHDSGQLELRYNYSRNNYGFATLLPLVEAAFLALVLGMKSSSSSLIYDVAGPLPFQAPPLAFDEAASLPFDDAAFLALVLGMKISLLFVAVIHPQRDMLNPPAHGFSSLDQICPMPVDLEKFCLDLFPNARWVCRQSPIIISSDLKDEAGTIDKFLKWNLLIVPSKFDGCLQKLDGHKCGKTTIRRCHLRQDTMS